MPPKKKTKRQYRVLQDIYYGDTHRAPGDVADDIPAESLRWLQDDGLIEPVEGDEAPQSDEQAEPETEEID